MIQLMVCNYSTKKEISGTIKIIFAIGRYPSKIQIINAFIYMIINKGLQTQNKMKKVILITGVLIMCYYSDAQTNSNFRFYTPSKNQQQCITPEQHKAIKEKLKESKAALIRDGKLIKLNSKSMMTTSFVWPVEQTNGLNDYAVHYIANFVDQDTSYPNQLLDYNCGNRTYDLTEGYNHGGTDISLWPFGWYKMDSSQVKIVAAASGTIIGKDDGNADHNCGGTINDNWNAVYLQHSDGSVTWYGHMKNGSLTNKTVGQTVAAGEYLGLVGSSGFSTGPHLHFEVYDANDNLIDPFAGTCNSLNSTSWWASQRPYFDSGINALRTQSATAVFPNCPQTETPNEQTFFCSGQEIFFSTYYRDQQVGQLSQYKVFRPDNSIWQQWTDASTVYYDASYWEWNYFLPSGAPSGIWKFQVIFEGQTYERLFYVEVIPAISVAETTLTCDITGAAYQWIDCNNGNTPISGASNQSFTASVNGSYAVVVTQNACSKTSSCADITNTGTGENLSSSAITIYPNPFTSETTITFNEEQKQVEIKITDILGKEIKTINFTGKQLVFAKEEIKEGIYFVLISNFQHQVTGKRKIIIQ